MVKPCGAVGGKGVDRGIGVVEKDKRMWQEVDTPQGSVISLLLENVYLHYAQKLCFSDICTSRTDLYGGSWVMVK